MSDTPAAPGHPLESIFNPGSIAIVGASADPAKRGYQILRALGESGYRGQVLPVNPKGGRIHGHQVVPSIESLPVAADLAVLCTPAPLAPGLIGECGRRGIGAAVVLAVGFKESGPEGAELEEQLAEEGRTHGVRIIGPNTSGILNLHARVNLIGARGVRPGGIALLVQSGNMALALMNEVTERTSDGVSICVGIGNETDIGFADTLEYLAQHDETRTIVVHAEGMRDPRRFLDIASAIRGEKPIVMIKGARSLAGAASALSHTGAVAGPYDRFRAGLRQAGVTEITRTDELLHAAETLGNQRSAPPGSGVAVVTDGGGHGALAVDTLTEMGVSLAALSEDTKTSLRRLLGPAAAVSNPVDLAGAADGDPLVFARAVELVSRDGSVGSVLVVGLFGGYGIRFADSLTESEVTAAHSMGRTGRDVGVVVHSMYAGYESNPLEVLRSQRIPVIGSLDVACRCIVALHERGRTLAARPWRDIGEGPATEPHGPGRVALTEPEARTLLHAHGLTFSPWVVANGPEEAVAAAERVISPGAVDASVAIKVVSSQILHKTDAGGVALGLSTPEEIHRACEELHANAVGYTKAQGLTAETPSFLVTCMAPRPAAELLIGAYRDPGLGPVLTLGSGGTWVEILDDVAHRVLPVQREDILDMLEELRAGAVLHGARGASPLDLEGVVVAATAVARCIQEEDAVVEVEINPLFVYEERAEPIDARVLVSQA